MTHLHNNSFSLYLDQNKLGQKLLEMMGWSKGKGLGRDEQGDVEPVRLNYKCDTKGMGYKGNDDGWLAHKEEFSAILSELNGTDSLPEDNEAIGVKSLESRSKGSRARVHYHKFTRGIIFIMFSSNAIVLNVLSLPGKDISNYSAQDLACILGTRKTTKEQEAAVEIEEEKEEPTKEGDEVDHSHGIVTIHKGNIQEYFASKMAALRNKTGSSEPQAENGALMESSVDQEEQMEGVEETNSKKRVRFNEDLNVVNEFSAKMRILAETPKESKKLKKKKKETTEETPVEGEEKKNKSPVGDQTVAEEDGCSVHEEKAKTKKKKKKNRKEKVEEEEKGNECSAAEVMELNEGEAAVKKKPKKMRNGRIDEVTSADVSEVKQIDAAGVEQEPKRKEKKKKKKMKEESSAEEAGQSRKEESVVEVSESSNGDKSQKKKKKKDEAAATVVDAVQPEESKKKKKKKKTDETLEPMGEDCAASVMESQEMKASDEAIELESGAGDGPEHVKTSKKEKKKRKLLEHVEEGTKRKKTDGLDSSAVPLKKLKKDDGDDVMEPETKVDAPQDDNPQTKKPDFSYLGSSVKSDTLKKAEAKYLSSNFDLFVGANLHTITGYGYV